MILIHKFTPLGSTTSSGGGNYKRLWRPPPSRIKRRNKSSSFAIVRAELSFQAINSHLDQLILPSVLGLLGCGAAAAAAAAVFLGKKGRDKELGLFRLFTSPMPFNRFVASRCPSLKDVVDEKVVGGEERCVVGRIRRNLYDEVQEGKGLAYQRVCVSCEDGGVVSLDWPASLELGEDSGLLDTTVVIVPGTAEGSMDREVTAFVCECLRRGCFPIVVNPRGCANSPLTTPRLFSAAGSGDFSTAIQFITRARVRTTLMGVAWGLGANMLTKYLAEVGEKTPLVAAACIDNPFDLDAVASSGFHILNQKLTGGLIDILQSNKELFHGLAKGFDVGKALRATSLRDFDEAISVVSYGFDSIEDFYDKSSTRGLVGVIKIPLLFIQNENGIVPLFSVPRELIAKNPFTSLLLCSSPLDVVSMGSFTVPWCQQLIIEWLTAVELGLLKGRHPLLKDAEVNRIKKFQKFSHLHRWNPHIPYSVQETRRNFGVEVKESKLDSNDGMSRTTPISPELVNEGGLDVVDSEGRDMVQTAQVVMHMLDLSMPETLTEEQKKKVMAAVGQGETLMKALRDAVPEDVRGNLTNAVSSILREKHSNVMEELLNINQFPEATLGLNSKIFKEVGLSSSEGGDVDPYAVDRKIEGSDLSGDSRTDQLDKSSGVDQIQSTGITGGDASSSVEMSTNGSVSTSINAEISEGSNELYLEPVEFDSGAKPEMSSTSSTMIDRKVAYTAVKEESNMQRHGDEEEDTPPSYVKLSATKTDEEIKSSETEAFEQQKWEEISEQPELSPSASTSGLNSPEAEIRDSKKSERKSEQIIPNLNDASSATFSVSKALDALTGIDDSTQEAVNTVFSVIEDMITQMEERRDDGSDVNGRSKIDGQCKGSVSENHHLVHEGDLEKVENIYVHKGNLEKKENMYNVQRSCLPKKEKCTDETGDKMCSGLKHGDEMSVPNSASSEENCIIDSQGNSLGNQIVVDSEQSECLVHTPGKSLYPDDSGCTTSRCITKYSQGDHLYQVFLQNCFISMVSEEESSHLDASTFLDYSPEGQWKILKHSALDDAIVPEGVDMKLQNPLRVNAEYENKVIEPAYVILDDETDWTGGQFEEKWCMKEANKIATDSSGKVLSLVKKNILDSLKVEVCRRVPATDVEEIEPYLASELECFADEVSLFVVHGIDHQTITKCVNSAKADFLDGELIVKAISLALQHTRYIKRLLPVGIIVGSTFASLRKTFSITVKDFRGQREAIDDERNNPLQAGYMEITQRPLNVVDQDNTLSSSFHQYKELKKSKSGNNKSAMVGSVTAALGASALLAHQYDSQNNSDNADTSLESFNRKTSGLDPEQHEEEMCGKCDSNIVTSLAEKAMSVAGPVVPTTEDGEVDQERLVAMLAALGQKGGILKVVGKVALFWGGLRGAMSLTDKLISFLRIAERPLYQRILGFVGMLVVLWTPVVVPLLPTLVHNWSTHSPSKIADFICIIGLYFCTLILVMLWGKRIRGYDDPLEQYGINLTASKQMQNLLHGFVGGVLLVIIIHSLNASLGYVVLSYPTIPRALDAVSMLKFYGRGLRLLIQGLATATAVALAEELLFRSWLTDEIAVDLGYHRGVILSGIVFSLCQRSIEAIPGLWLLSLGLAGARQRNKGSLSLPIGLRAGILASSFVLRNGGFVSYRTDVPIWLGVAHPFQPFSGVGVGFAVALLWAILLYPRQPLHMAEKTRIIKD